MEVGTDFICVVGQAIVELQKPGNEILRVMKTYDSSIFKFIIHQLFYKNW